MDTDEPPEDLWDGYIPTDHHLTLVAAEHPRPVEEPEPSTEEFEDVELTVEAALAIEAMIRDHLGVPEPTDADIRRMQDRANAWHDCPATPERPRTSTNSPPATTSNASPTAGPVHT